ncbi:DUF4123 domain-containing protein [Paracoccus sulfuroxidans]|uniref:Uncharacterized protein DUF4123 n=1 Tax=Paracoccus sulfuroxidans TaxID=384678 RepID=A0A562NNU9_9RHOB|nr:DUF4123 domain-containing protein [Paracoccus sulfuroxidans]TWI33877.1 uncharacterized protein DUF4123 [Paracoccus sulfuroxidans]
MEPWIGRFHLRARGDEGRRQIGNRDEAARWLMLSAFSAEDFQTGMRHALGRIDFDMISATSISRATQARDLGVLADDLHRLLPQVNQIRPVALGEFTPAPPPAESWDEVDWDAALSAPGALWAVVDGVNWPEISKILGQSDAEHACLYSTLNPEGRALAPWLVRIDPNGAFVALLRARPQKLHSFVLLNSNASLDQMRGHLRRFTMMRTPHDTEAAVYFRFYDPRVMIDALEAMPDSFRDSFTRPLDAIIVPVSTECLLPEAARLTGPAMDVFDPPESLNGRLLRWTGHAPSGAHRRGPGEVTQAEFTALSLRMQRRAIHQLARRLQREYGNLTSDKRCLSIAEDAPASAAAFDMTSASQVLAIARAQLLFGTDFERRYPEAGAFLNDRSLLPWQKKNQLADWFDQMTSAHGLEQKESA